MTHGAGGISQGAGGQGDDHCNGRQQESNGDDTKCSALCYPLLFLLCLVKMKTIAKIRLTWLYCFIGASVAGGLVRLHNTSEVLYASPTDMRKLKHTGFLCESVEINATTKLTVYNFKSVPEINESSSSIYEFKASTVLPRGTATYWQYYFLKNSVTLVSICPDKGINLYIIKGEKNIYTWKKSYKQDALCSSCFENKYFFSNCSGSPDNVTFKASSSDLYYILLSFDEKEHISTHVNFIFILDRKVYGFKDSYTVCLDSADCFVPLSFRVTKSIVLYLPRESSYKIHIMAKCNPRITTYIVLFAVLPFCCGTIVTVIILRKHKERSRTDSQGCATSNSERLHGNTQ